MARVEHEEHERLQKLHHDEELRRLRKERLAWYHRWLVSDLEAMTKDWETADRIRAFLAAYEGRLDAEHKSELVMRWLESARRYVSAIDPLARVGSVARRSTRPTRS